MERFGGVVIVMIAGLLNAAFAIPMRYNRHWKWENTWLVFSFWSLLVFPWLFVVLLVAHAGELFGSLTFRELAPALVFGFLWGVAQATFGISIKLLGVSIAIPVVSAIAIILGAFIPLLARHPEALAGRLGLSLMLSSLFLVAGLVVYARASRMREKGSIEKTSRAGLLLAIFTGIVGGALNIGFGLSEGIVNRSEAMGNGPRASTYPVWAVLLAAGFVPNFIYCLYMTRKNKTWLLFTAEGFAPDLLRSVLMAVFWILATTLYGVSTTYMGKFGSSVGYLLYGSFTILFANILGWKAGEWAGASSQSQKTFWAGMGLVLAGVGSLGLLP